MINHREHDWKGCSSLLQSSFMHTQCFALHLSGSHPPVDPQQALLVDGKRQLHAPCHWDAMTHQQGSVHHNTQPFEQCSVLASAWQSTCMLTAEVSPTVLALARGSDVDSRTLPNPWREEGVGSRGTPSYWGLPLGAMPSIWAAPPATHASQPCCIQEYTESVARQGHSCSGMP